LSVTLRQLSRFQKHQRDKIRLLDGRNIKAATLVTLATLSEGNSPCRFLLRFSLFLSVTSVTSVTTEKNHEVAVSRLCAADTSKRDRRNKMESRFGVDRRCPAGGADMKHEARRETPNEDTA
jgi:hypothetical protein